MKSMIKEMRFSKFNEKHTIHGESCVDSPLANSGCWLGPRRPLDRKGSCGVVVAAGPRKAEPGRPLDTHWCYSGESFF